jgi:hypothetical protein
LIDIEITNHDIKKTYVARFNTDPTINREISPPIKISNINLPWWGYLLGITLIVIDIIKR